MRTFNRLTYHQAISLDNHPDIMTVSVAILHPDIQAMIPEDVDKVIVVEGNGYHDFIYVPVKDGYDRIDLWYY